jgi:hypothetical protein
MTCEGYDVSGEDPGGQDPVGSEPTGDQGAAGGEPAGGQGAANGAGPAGGGPVGGQDASGGPGTADGEAPGGGGAAGDEAAWQDLVARYDLPADPAGTDPWPDRESLIPPPARDQGPAGHASAQHEPAAYGPGADGDRARVIRPAAPPPVSARASSSTAADAGDAGRSDEPGDDTEEHFIPPRPPPLPNLDPVAKGAWTALFGGPAYLLVATLVGWTVPGWAALLAVMAFVGGFAVIVMRLGDGPSSGAGPDNGAVL